MSTVIENKEFWQNQLEKLKASGLTRAQYCRDNGVNYDRFVYWLKQLSPASSTFVPVKLQAPEALSYTTTLCTIELRGHVLKLHDMSALSFVLDRLA